MASANSVEHVRAEVYAMQLERDSPHDRLRAAPAGDVVVESQKATLRAFRDLQIQMFRQYEDLVAHLEALGPYLRGSR